MNLNLGGLMNVMPLMFAKLKQTRHEVIEVSFRKLFHILSLNLDYRFQRSFISWFNNMRYFEYSLV